MNLFSLISMVFVTWISFLMIRSLAPFQEKTKLKYVSLKSNFLANCLIPKQKGYVKVNDRKKISLFSLIFYLLFVVLVITLVLMFFIPTISCEEFVASFGRHRRIKWSINTLNEKIVFLLPMIFFLIELIAYFSIEILPTSIRNKTESKKSLYGIFAIYILFVLLLVLFVILLLSR